MFALGLFSFVASIVGSHLIARFAMHRRNDARSTVRTCTAMVTDGALEALGRLICIVTAVIGVLMMAASQTGLGA